MIPESGLQRPHLCRQCGAHQMTSGCRSIISLRNVTYRATGRKRIDRHRALDGMICRARTRARQNLLFEDFGDDRSVFRASQRGKKLKALTLIWMASVAECDELDGVNWGRPAADTSMGQARQKRT